MTDFADGISDTAAARQLPLSMPGRGPFKQFKTRSMNATRTDFGAAAFRDVRAECRAIEWLLDQGLIDDGVANRFAADHPDPGITRSTDATNSTNTTKPVGDPVRTNALDLVA